MSSPAFTDSEGSAAKPAERRWHRLYFDDWVASEGLELIHGYKIENVHDVPLRHWARTGGNAVWMQLEGTGGLNGACICEIPPGKQLAPVRHLYEEIIYVLSGQGSSMVWYEGQRKASFEWTAGSLFSIPLNTWHQLRDGKKPSLMLHGDRRGAGHRE